jgi:hypothetical protein
MTDIKTIKDMYEELSLEYDERYHEEDNYNPEGYMEYLDGLTEDEIEELYNETFTN